MYFHLIKIICIGTHVFSFYKNNIYWHAVKKRFAIPGLQLYNLLPINIKNEVNENIFRRKCINFILFNDLYNLKIQSIFNT